MEELLTPDQLAAVLNVDTGTLANWRYQRTGPPYTKAGKCVRYRPSDVEEWLRENTIRQQSAV